MERKLAAILSADVKGYSRLMAENEEATIETLTLYRRLMRTLIEQHRGRVVDSPGDNLLAEFGSVVDAVQGAVAIQLELNARNIELEPHRRMEFRIGINLGDVVADGDQIYGDGVNIAARVESLADAGGICISGTVHEHIKNKLPLGYVSLGEKSVKNISDPIRVYRVQAHPDIESAQADSRRSAAKLADPRARAASAFGIPTLALVLTAGVALGVLAIGLLFLSTPDPAPTSKPGGGGAQVASGASTRGVAAPLEQAAAVESRRADVEPPPSQTEATATAVGVMNFRALNPDPQSSWMREAIRDNLNGQLNKVSGLEVFSKEYIDFLVEDGESEIKVAHDLGISRMISGSYLAQGDRLRIEAHVVNVQTGLLEVSDSVEGAQADFFELQSELAFKIAGHLDFTLSPEDRTAIASTPSAPRLDAYRLLLEAEGETSQGESLEDQHLELPESPREDEAATELPSFLQWGWLGPRAAWAEETVSPETEIRRLLELYRRAYETKDLEMLGSVYIDLTPKQRGAREKYFQNTQDLEVEIHKVRIAVRGDEAVVSYTREDQFTDLQTGETVKLDVRLTKRLHRIDGGWKMVGRKK